MRRVQHSNEHRQGARQKPMRPSSDSGQRRGARVGGDEDDADGKLAQHQVPIPGHSLRRSFALQVDKQVEQRRDEDNSPKHAQQRSRGRGAHAHEAQAANETGQRGGGCGSKRRGKPVRARRRQQGRRPPVTRIDLAQQVRMLGQFRIAEMDEQQSQQRGVGQASARAAEYVVAEDDAEAHGDRRQPQRGRQRQQQHEQPGRHVPGRVEIPLSPACEQAFPENGGGQGHRQQQKAARESGCERLPREEACAQNGNRCNEVPQQQAVGTGPASCVGRPQGYRVHRPEDAVPESRLAAFRRPGCDLRRLETHQPTRSRALRVSRSADP